MRGFSKIAAVLPSGTRKTRGAWFHSLIAGTLLVGAFLHLVAQDGDAFLYYFFLPVTAGAVIQGRISGLVYAGTAVVLVLASIILESAGVASPMLAEAASSDALITAERTVLVLLWASFLGLDGYLVGLVSERGGHGRPVQQKGAEAITAVERERTRMAYDIHDGLAQTMNTAVLETEILETLAGTSEPTVREQVARLKRVLVSGIAEMRGMIGNLKPPALSAAEFDNTFTQMIDDFADRNRLKVELSLDADLTQYSDSMRICVFRVVQEALSNIERHAHASRVRIAVKSARRAVLLFISDDGMGFDAETVLSVNGNGASAGHSPNGHFGVKGMRERVSLLAGTFQVDTAPQQGTTLRAYIPSGRR